MSADALSDGSKKKVEENHLGMPEGQTINDHLQKARKNISAYIHIPFCEHICYYCDFNKVFLEGQPVDEYIEALLKEIEADPLVSAYQ